MAKVKIPKRVGGMKIPKKVRKRAKKALKVAESPALREFAAAALGAAAGRRRAGAAARIENGRAPSGAARLEIDGAELAEAICAAALDGVGRFLEGLEEGLRAASAAAGGDATQAAPERPHRPERAKRPERTARPKRPARPSRTSRPAPGAGPA